MPRNINKIVLIVIASLIAVLTIIFAIIFRIKHIKNTSSLPTVLHTESSVSSSESAYSSAPTVSVPDDNGIKLVITNPPKGNFTVTEPAFTFKGTSDIEKPLTVNGKELPRNKDGSFSYDVSLNLGKNNFNFSHKDVSVTYIITYRYVVIQSFTPSGAQSYANGASFPVTAFARNNSKVTASFAGQTIDLTPQADSGTQPQDAFITYSGSFNLPSGNIKDIVYNPITFTATYNGITESFKSGKITCRKPDFIKDSDPSITPNGSLYTDVGSGVIAEIIHYEAETFDAFSTNDWSKPTNSYLPKGTVDYCSTNYLYHNSKGEQKEYAVLRCGKQVYTKRKDKPNTEVFPVIKTYIGTLPDHNEIEAVSLSSGTKHTELVFNTLWKAPFYFNIGPQNYKNPKYQEFEISQFTATYIDITFCYATVFKGELTIPADNPLFSSAQIIPNYDTNGNIIDTTVRLNLKKTSGFYGWNASYNNNGQLVFEFLNPSKISSAQNEYGVDLTGIKILIDVGHGGKDVGALGFDYVNHSEAKRNLILAKKIGSELLKLGATVYLTREEDVLSTTDDKIQKLKRIKPDLCIAIHHNSGNQSYLNGFDSYYFTPFSMNASYYVYKNTVSANLYKKYDLGWHYYYVARTTVCPVVLTENGYMSNSEDYQNIINNEVNNAKAQAITKGVAEYFLSIQ